jgi:hypothetical protein
MERQNRAEHWIKRNVGYVPGLIYHDFHGKKKLRRCETRGQILAKSAFNPDTDIKYDSQGVLHLEVRDQRQIKLRDAIRKYFRDRDEDSTEL